MSMFGSIIELGIFLVCLGGTFYLFIKGVDLINRTRASAREKELEKKE
jgi:hypothetical protein